MKRTSDPTILAVSIGQGVTMTKRKTILKDPLTDLDQPAIRADEPTVAPDDKGAVRTFLNQGLETVATLKDTATRSVRQRFHTKPEERAQQATGGQLELLGGTLGTGTTSIQRFGADKRLGFVSTAGDFINLESDIESISAKPDREEHRALSAIGWAWGVGALMGPAGVLLGGGIRFLHPRRMILEMRLRNGRTLVARTDSVTVNALQELARKSAAGAAEQPA